MSKNADGFANICTTSLSVQGSCRKRDSKKTGVLGLQLNLRYLGITQTKRSIPLNQESGWMSGYGMGLEELEAS